MSIRVSHRNQYSLFNQNINDAYSKLVDLANQGSTQSRVNKPSDDPSGMVRILGHRSTLNGIGQHMVNVKTATGWLGMADNTLNAMSTTLTQLRQLSEESATGTLTAQNREQIAVQVRQLMDQLIGQANVEYEGEHVFAGHKTDQSPYKRALWLSDNDGSTLNARGEAQFGITGDLEHSAMIQFNTSGKIGDGSPIDYRYSTDGGKTFTKGRLTNTAADPLASPPVSGDQKIVIQGATITLKDGMSVNGGSATDDSMAKTNGTWLTVRPTAQYVGDDLDGVKVEKMGAHPAASTVSASGVFSGNISVRYDEDTALTVGETVKYSYSLDGGASWVSGQTASVTTDGEVQLLVPGGHVDVSANPGDTLPKDSQLLVHPRTAGIEIEIGNNEFVQLNTVGKDVFGGVYSDPDGNSAQLAGAMGTSSNLFDVLGRFVGYLETNDQQGCQQIVEDLKDVSSHVLDEAARVGARENRVQMTEKTLGTLKDNETKRLSAVEDVDFSELLRDLMMQQTIYKTVLSSSSQIMKLSLADFM